MAYPVSTSTVLTLLGFCATVIFIVYVCYRFACAVAKRRRRRRQRLPQYTVSAYVFPFRVVTRHPHPAGAAAGGAGVGGRRGAGLDPAAVAAFPTSVFERGPRRDSAGSDDADSSQCVVCLAEYEDKDMLRILPSCGHNFHMACIDLWLEKNSTCPVCRISLRGNIDKKQATPPPISIEISPPCSPAASGSDPCRCLFPSTGHSSRASDVPRQQPDLENQIASSPSVDGAANNLPPSSEVNSTPENNGQKQVDRSAAQLEEPCK